MSTRHREHPTHWTASFPRTPAGHGWILAWCAALSIWACATTSQAQQLTNGGNHDGTILLNQTNTWTLTATAGDTLILRSGRVSGDANFNPWLRLYDPSGNLVESNPMTTADNVTELELTAGATGTYSLQISDGSFGRTNDRGSYRLYFLRLPGAPVIADEGGPMTNGGNHDGVIEVGDLDLWTFSGQSGDKIVLRSGRLSGDPNFNPWLRLYDQSGVVVASTATATAVSAVEISLTLTNTGTFTLLIADSTSGRADDQGEYRLQFARLPGSLTVADDGGILTSGDNRGGRITLGDLDPWTFTAEAGDRVILRSARPGDEANFNPWMRLYNAAGELVADTGSGSLDSTREIAQVVTNSGVFTVLLCDGSSGGFDQVGDYRVYFVKIPGRVVDGEDSGMLTNGVVVSAVMEKGDLDTWQFLACRESALTLRLERLSTVNNFNPQLDLYGPGGVAVASRVGAAAIELSLFATNGGVYTVVVRDTSSGGFDGTGTYRIVATGILSDELQLCQPLVQGSNVNIAAIGGQSNAEAVLFTSPNLEEDRTLWTPFHTNRFDATGVLSVTNLPYLADPQRYYYLLQR